MGLNYYAMSTPIRWKMTHSLCPLVLTLYMHHLKQNKAPRCIKYFISPNLIFV
jgi:hypothetical protein